MIKFRKANSADYKRFAFVHTQAFEGFFLTTLGQGFLSTYYRACLKSYHTIAVCAYDEEDNIIGFASGSTWSKGYNKNIILANKMAFGLAALNIIMTRPLALVRLINNLSKNNNEEDKGDYAELLSIAILPTHKGLGIGKQILIEFEKEALAKNCHRISLTTDFDNNEDVIKFYKKLDYEVFYNFITYPNRKMIKMIKHLTKN